MKKGQLGFGIFVLVIIMMGIVLWSAVNDAYAQREQKDLIDMDCLELINELDDRPYFFKSDNDRYNEDIFRMILIKECKLK